MLDAAHSNRPERRSALIAHELSRLNVNIATLRNACFLGEGSLQEHGTRYTLSWSGKPTTKGHLSGVGFMVSTSIASKLENLPRFSVRTIQFFELNLQKKTSSTRSSAAISKAPLQTTRGWSLVISMLERAKMQIPGMEYLALVTAMATGTCCWSFALSSN